MRWLDRHGLRPLSFGTYANPTKFLNAVSLQKTPADGQIVEYVSAVRRIGQALYYNVNSTPQATESYFVKIQDAVGNVDGDGPGNNSYCAVDGHNGRGMSRYGKVRSRNFRSACGFANFNRDVSVDTIEAIDSQNQAYNSRVRGISRPTGPPASTPVFCA